MSHSVGLWNELNACPTSTSGDAGPSLLSDGGLDATLAAGSTVVHESGAATCYAWSGCKDDSAVELRAILGGEHAWPGGMDLVGGKASRDIDATRTMLDFFDAHPMP